MEIERRYFTVPDLEVRASEDGKPFVVKGHAATFNEPYGVADFREQVDPGAFDEALADEDVMALWNHNPDNVLGNVGSGSLRLSKDKRGLVSEIAFPASAAREREAVERGDVRRMSFGFQTLSDRWERREDGSETRTLLKVRLFDVSPVAFPANPKTDLKVAQRSREVWRASQDDPDAAERAHDHRVREMDLAQARG